MGLNEKHVTCERIETNKVMIRLKNNHVGHENRNTDSGTPRTFRSDSGVCVEVSKTNTRMSTYDSGMYRDMIRVTLRVGSVSEGQFGNRKCTLIGTWAGTRGGLSRDSKRVERGVLYGLRGQNSGQNSEQNYAGTKTCRAIE